MLNTVYSHSILDFAAHILLLGTLPDADAWATTHSRLCGSTVTVQLRIDRNVITYYAHEVRACALGQASSSIMGRNVVRPTVTELRQVQDEVREMLPMASPPPSGRRVALALFESARELKARHASVLLPFDAVVDALNRVRP
jgi:NifU-like protein involved in Fe-S cluster formation